jgi:uncharacterized protein (UPF0262 family)
MKKLVFQSKQKSNEDQEKAFLALTPSQRFVQFLKLCESMAPFQTKKKSNSKNFILERT